MEDEEEVIMALIEALPELVYCLGGKEFSPLIFESLEMLLFVDNPIIKAKVQHTITLVFNECKQVLTPVLFQMFQKMWATEEIAAKDMSLFFIDLIEESLDSVALQQIKEICLDNFINEMVLV